MANPFFSGRIPVELDKAVADHIQKTGETKTEILVKALASYLKVPIEPTARSIEVTQQEFVNLVRRIEAVEEILKTQHPVIISDNCDNEADSRDLKLPKLDQTTVITADNDNISASHTEENQFSTDNTSDNKVSLDKVIGPLSETAMAGFLGIGRAALKTYRQNLEIKNSPSDSVEKLKRKADGLFYSIKYIGETTGKAGRLTNAWTATPESTDN